MSTVEELEKQLSIAKEKEKKNTFDELMSLMKTYEGKYFCMKSEVLRGKFLEKYLTVQFFKKIEPITYDQGVNLNFFTYNISIRKWMTEIRYYELSSQTFLNVQAFEKYINERTEISKDVFDTYVSDLKLIVDSRYANENVVIPSFLNTYDEPKIEITNRDTTHLDFPHKKLQWRDFKYIEYNLRQYVFGDVLILSPNCKKVVETDLAETKILYSEGLKEMSKYSYFQNTEKREISNFLSYKIEFLESLLKIKL